MTGSILFSGALPQLLVPPAPLASFDWDVFFSTLWSDQYFQPVLLVIAITLVAQTSGVVLGFPLALGRISKNPLVHLPVDLYLFLFRGTPCCCRSCSSPTGSPSSSTTHPCSIR